MKYKNNILRHFFSIWIFIGSVFCQDLEVGDITIELQLLNTGWFTYSSWSEFDHLWDVNVTNNTNEEQSYRFHFELTTGTADQYFAGTTPIESLYPGEQIIISNKDQAFKDKYYLDYWFCNDREENTNICINDLEEIIKDLGHFPSGSNYTLKVQIVRPDDTNYIISQDQESMTFQLGDQFDSEEESQPDPIGSDFYFSWKSPGFREDILVQYKIVISAIVPGFAESPDEALDLGYSNPVYHYDSNWGDLPGYMWPSDFEELGATPRYYNIWYSDLKNNNDNAEFICGYDYAWRIYARECFDNNCNDGIWGWPEPKESPIRQFTWGGIPSGLQSIDGSSVLPQFSWNQVFCEMTDVYYELEIKKLASAFDGENILLSASFDYKYDLIDPALIPDQTYKWRVRVKSEVNNYNLPWSSDAGQFTIDNLESPQPSGLISTVKPTFNIDGPSDVASYQILITSASDHDDIIYNGEALGQQVDFDIDGWKFEPEDPYNGLFPNSYYYYEIILLDEYGVKLDVDFPGNANVDQAIFFTSEVELEEPTDNETNVSINQLFKWDGPSSVPRYRFELTDESGTFSDPQVQVEVEGSTAYQYPLDGDYPLKYNTTYYWRVLPMDNAGNISTNISPPTYSDEWEFKTSDFAELIAPVSGSELGTVRPRFEIATPPGVSYITIKISNEDDENITNTPLVYGTQEDSEQEKIYQNNNLVLWDYPSQNIEYGLHPGSKYYWQYLMFDDNDELFGDINDYEIIYFTIKEIELQFPEEGEKNIPLNQIFIWEGPIEVPEYEFWLSDEEDPNLENPKIKIDGIEGNTLEYPENGEFPLEYEEIYYWRVVSKDINSNLGLFPSYSNIFQFTASDFPELGEEVSPSSIDPRMPIISITTVEGLEYTILIFSDSDGNTIIDELTGITEFPFEYTAGEENLQYGTTYYIQVQPMKEGEIFGPPSIMMPFIIPEESINTQQCEISCEITENILEPEILTTILEGIEGATDYLILLSENEDMSNSISIYFSSSESQYTIPSEYVEWGGTYYTQVIALSNDESLGLPSDIQIVNIESKPGMNEQTSLDVTIAEGSSKPTFEIINQITGATGYRIIISTAPDMSTEFWQYDLTNSMIYVPSNDGIKFQYGQSYYVTAQALDDDEVHGIISNIVGFFIPNITPPVLGEAFNWEVTVPPADQYLLEVSLIEDFSVIIINDIVVGTTHPVNMDELEFNKGYYWRVQGLDPDGEYFGNSSLIQFLQTEAIPKPILNVVSEEVSLTPEFTWSGIEMTSVYQITVSSDEGMENILWQENITNTSAVYPESAILLTYSTTYYLQISALDENDSPLSESSIETFSTKSVYAVVGLNPDGGTETLTPTLQWEANEKIASYQIVVASDPEMGNIVVNENTDENSIKINENKLLSGANYYWLVNGLDKDGESAAGPSTIASLNMPSVNKISLISPSVDEQVKNLNPSLKWTGLLGVTSYILKLSTDPEFETLIINKTILSTETIIPDENKLTNSTLYFWQIQGSTEQETVTSQMGSFSTPATTAITIKTLEDGESISITNPVFSWESEEGISAFAIRFDDNADFAESWNFQTGTTSFEYPGEPLLNFDTPYYWQVSPLDNEGNAIGDWIASRRFSINIAFIVELELPGNGETATTSNPTFQWKSIEGVSKYEIQVSSSEDFSEIIWTSSEIIENNTVYPKSGAEQLHYDQSYYWRVRALGEKHPLGDFSTIFSFDISGKNKVVLEGPLSDGSESLLPYFSWEPVISSSGYTLTLASDESISTIIYSGDATEVFLPYPESAPPLDYGIKYYWNVFAKDENGNSIGDISDVGSFNTPSGTIKIEFIFGKE